jgi:hypothetical protein
MIRTPSKIQIIRRMRVNQPKTFSMGKTMVSPFAFCEVPNLAHGRCLVAPLPLQPEGEIDEVDPDDLRGLREEIRSHNRSDIPHKNDHLLEEDEEYDDDEPEHHVDGRPPGYDSYSVLDETDPNDLEVFQVAERDHSGIKGSRTIEQMSLQEMDSRRQPGDAVRAVSA